MNDDQPVRLKDARAVSPELAHALRALGRSSDLERLGRVAQKLEGAVAGASLQPSAAAGGGSLAGKWLVLGVLAAGGSAGFWGWRAERAPLQRMAAVHPAPAAASVNRSAGSAAPTVNANVTGLEARMASPEGDRTLRSARASSSHRMPRSASANAPGSASVANTPEVPPRSTSVATLQTPAGASTPVEPAIMPAILAEDREAPQTAPSLHERSHSQPPPAAAARAGHERSEAALLLAARKAQPSAALELLAEHATRFPDGLLAPERDVLRIEALRKLGQAAEAERQLRAFEARYPGSLHLSRLRD